MDSNKRKAFDRASASASPDPEERANKRRKLPVSVNNFWSLLLIQLGRKSSGVWRSEQESLALVGKVERR